MAGSEQSGPPRPAAVPYLAVKGAREAIDWYGTVFGAVVEGEPFVRDDGSIGHAALRIGDGVIYLGRRGALVRRGGADRARGRGEPDAAGARRRGDLRRRRAARGRARRPWRVRGNGSRNAWFVDPFGHRWGVSSPLSA